MPKRPRAASLSRAEALAAAVAVWGELAPPPRLSVEPRGPVYFSARAYAEQYEIAQQSALRRLDALVRKKKLTFGVFRVGEQRQPKKVYWPVGVKPPGESNG
jgi:hypothetical protein